jgi:hypothetical protein
MTLGIIARSPPQPKFVLRIARSLKLVGATPVVSVILGAKTKISTSQTV